MEKKLFDFLEKQASIRKRHENAQVEVQKQNAHLLEGLHAELDRLQHVNRGEVCCCVFVF